MSETEDPFRHFTSSERSCLERFLDTLRSVLGSELLEVWLFGSFARGDMWGPRMPMNSDIDLLVVTAGDVMPDVRESLLNETYPLYLECGRQISTQFWSGAKFDRPTSEASVALKDRLVREGKRLLGSVRS